MAHPSPVRSYWGYRITMLALSVVSAALGLWAMQDGHAAPTTRQKMEHFDQDPGWDGHNNRTQATGTRPVRQEFGYSRTTNADATPGEIGGWITPDAEPAYYGQVLQPRTLDQPLSASGTLMTGTPDRVTGNTLVGFFNADTLNEWRTPNSIVLRINGRGEGFHLHLEYATSRWRAGGNFYVKDAAAKRPEMRLFSGGKAVHTWSLQYDPAGNNGGGQIRATLDGEPLVLNLEAGHKADGATFNRFGILNVMKSADDGGALWLDHLTVNGTKVALDRDPGWAGSGNHRSYDSANVRPRFDFGYSKTRFAGGRAAGEIGGRFYRGDERYPERMAYYGDRIGALSLDQPLHAAGKVCLRRGVTDSTTLFGFFHSEGSMRHSTAQLSGFPENFLGVSIEGPSRDGFFFYPAVGLDQDSVSANGAQNGAPIILPDGKPHDWSLDYAPNDGQAGRVTVTLDGKAVALELTPELRKIGARFDRFGFITTHIDGNGQTVYLDDLTYAVTGA